ncbi:hypothetical protein [Leifsonia sp. NPDC058230]|uniref:hypothetical protein n=1 Tax=Leifsonia sp. NPDC058230 TaxID=3346391 RepID=UPI0036DBE6EA
MRTRTGFIIFLAGCAAAVVAIAAWGNSGDTSSARPFYPWLLGGVVFMAILGTFAFRRAREVADRTAAPDSVEARIAVQIRAAVLVDALVLGVLVGVVALMLGSAWSAGLVMLSYVAVLVVDVWIRYLISSNRIGGADVEQDS